LPSRGSLSSETGRTQATYGSVDITIYIPTVTIPGNLPVSTKKPMVPGV
jgi:hypothetical protein